MITNYDVIRVKRSKKTMAVWLVRTSEHTYFCKMKHIYLASVCDLELRMLLYYVYLCDLHYN